MSRDLEALRRLVDQDWREHAACRDAWRSCVEFVDPSPADVPELVRDWCFRCTVVGHCREEADRLAPFKHLTVMGGRAYQRGEPVDGFTFEESA